MRRSAGLAVAALSIASLWTAPPAAASLPSLRISPLQYSAHLELDHPKVGFIEASNPTGTLQHVTIEVEGFRQINDRGELQYYRDERLAAGIQPGLSSFDLGPREAIRVKFTIDPNRLGPGGAYGVIFLRTTSGSPASTQTNTSERVGTLLILDVAGAGHISGHISGVNLPRISYGHPTLPLGFSYTNTGQGSGALAFAPALTIATGWHAQPQSATGPFVFPGRTRQFRANLTLGNRLWLIPVTVQDTTPGSLESAVQWTFVVSGVWTWLLPVMLILFLAMLLGLVFRRRLAGLMKSELAIAKAALTDLALPAAKTDTANTPSPSSVEAPPPNPVEALPPNPVEESQAQTKRTKHSTRHSRTSKN
jgi:hypothetical protein